jgi:hypothetical protein
VSDKYGYAVAATSVEVIRFAASFKRRTGANPGYFLLSETWQAQHPYRGDPSTLGR